MRSKIENKLKKLGKDKKSIAELKELFKSVAEERDTFEKRLNLLESAIRTDYDSILITTLELDKPGPKIVYVNDGFTRMTGYSREEVIGKTPRILQGPKTDRDVLDKLRSRLEKGESFFGQAINYRKDGTEFVNQWDIHPLLDNKGNITHWVSYQHDITERKKAEEVLVKSDLDFDELRSEAHRTVLDIDEQGNVVMANKAFRELTGYTKDELKKIKVWDLFPKKYRESLKKRFDEVSVLDKFDNKEFKGIIRHKTGSPIQIAGESKILDLKDQTLIRAEIQNVSLQKKVMDTLRKRNENFFRIFNKVSEFVYGIKIKDDTPIIDYVSEKFPVITGISADTVTDTSDFQIFIHQDDLDTLKKHLRKTVKGKSCTCEYRLKTASGDYISVLDYAKPEWDKNQENVIGIKGSVSLKYKLSPEQHAS